MKRDNEGIHIFLKKLLDKIYVGHNEGKLFERLKQNLQNKNFDR